MSTIDTLLPVHQFVWDDDKLVVIDEVAARKIRRGKLSASSMKGLTSCPAKWAYESANRKPDEPFAATSLGTEMHAIYEIVYDEEKTAVGDRDKELFTRLINERAEVLWGDATLGENPTSVERKALASNKKKWLREITSRVMGILKIEDPKSVVVMRAHQRPDGSIVFEADETTKPVSGIELGADNVKIAGIPFIGYIDRIRVDGCDTDNRPFLIAEDYKSSKSMPWLKKGDSDDDGDQVVLYAEIIRLLTGDLPEESRLLYTKVGKDRIVKITDRVLARAIKRFVLAYQVMDHSASQGAYPAQETKFCAWCPIVDSCPVAVRNETPRGSDRTPNLHEVNLGIPTVRHAGSATLLSARGDELPTIKADLVTPITRTAEDMKDGKGSSQVRPEDVAERESITVQQKPSVPTMMESEKSAEADNRGAEAMPENHILTHKDRVPYDEFMPNSSELNPNSYSALAVFSLTELALTKLVEEYGKKVGVGHIRALTAVFAKVINRAHFEITGTRDGDKGVSIWQYGASSRIRFALRTVLDTYNDLPLLGGSEEDWEKWVDSTVKRIVVIANIAVGVWETNQTEVDDERPWEVLVDKSVEATTPAKKTTRKPTEKKEQ